MKTFYPLAIFLFTFPLFLESQNSLIDSLRSTLDRTFNDSDRVSLLVQLSDLSLKTSPHASETYAIQAIEVAKKINNADFEGKALNLLGFSQYQRQQFREAITSFDKANKVFRKLKNYEKVSDALNNIGSARQSLEEYNNALNILFSALRIRDSLNLDAKKAVTLQNIGNTYSQMGKMIEGEKYLLESLVVRDKIGNEAEIASSCLNLAAFYGQNEKYDLSLQYSARARIIKQKAGDKQSLIRICINEANAYSKKGDIDLSYQAYSEAIRLSEEINFRPGISASLMGIGVLFDTYKDYEKSIIYHIKALHEYSKQRYETGIANCFENIGNAYFMIDSVSYDRYLLYFLKADSLYKKLNNLDGIGRVTSNIGTAYRKMRQYDKAIFFLKKSIEINEKRGAISSNMHAYLSLGRCYLRMKDTLNAKTYIQKSNKLARSSRNKEVLSESSKLLGEILAEYNDSLKMAVLLMKESMDLKDSILDPKKQREVYKEENEAEVKNQVNAHVINIKKKEYHARLIITFIISLTFICFIVWLFIVWDKERNSVELLRKELLKENQQLKQSIDLYKINIKSEFEDQSLLCLRLINKKTKDISIKNIEYIESNRNHLVFHMIDGESFSIRGTISDFARDWTVPGLIERISKSFIINYKYVSKWEKLKVQMKNGMIIPIGKEYRNEIKPNQVTS